MRIAKLALILFTTLIASCGGKSGDSITTGDKSENLATEAQFLKISPLPEGYKVVILNPADTAKSLFTYYLIPKSAEVPQGLEDGVVIRTPVQNALVFSSVHASALKELGKLQIVKGVAEGQYFRIPEIVDGLRKGEIIDVGTFDSPSVEKAIAMEPDAILVSWYQGVNFSNLERVGLPVVYIADAMETTPIGRAEWIKFFGLLTATEKEADKIFNASADNYRQLKKEIAAASDKKRVKVLTENIYNGVWYVPGGGSYQAQLLADAGADYPWSDDKGTGSLSLGFEQVLERAGDADVWLLKVMTDLPNLEALASMDERYRHFDAFKKGNVFYCNTAQKPLFDEFPFHPDRLLKEYHLIFTGAPADSLRYFKRIGK